MLAILIAVVIAMLTYMFWYIRSELQRLARNTNENFVGFARLQREVMSSLVTTLATDNSTRGRDVHEDDVGDDDVDEDGEEDEDELEEDDDEDELQEDDDEDDGDDPDEDDDVEDDIGLAQIIEEPEQPEKQPHVSAPAA